MTPWPGGGGSGSSRSWMSSPARRWPSRSIPRCQAGGWCGCWSGWSPSAGRRTRSSGQRTGAGGEGLDQWAYERGVWLRFIEPGKPVQNAFVESFHGRLRDECLDRHWFVGLRDARQTVEAWRQDYNRARPHSALGYRPPEEFRQAFEASRNQAAGMGRTLIMHGPKNGGRSARLLQYGRCHRSEPDA